MRRLLALSLAGAVLSGCGSADGARAPTEPIGMPDAVQGKSGTTKLTSIGVDVLDDVLTRLLPSLGANGQPLDAPLRELRAAKGGHMDLVLLDATRQQLADLQPTLSPDQIADAEALSASLEAVAALSK